MPFTIEIDDRDWDVENMTRALALPAQRQYVAELTTDEPAHGHGTFHGDVQLLRLDQQTNVLTVANWSEEDGGKLDVPRQVDVVDIRRISFY